MGNDKAPPSQPLRWGMVVVFALIAVLVLLPMVAVFTDVTGNGYNRTQAVVNMLETGCKMYRVEFGVYPPAEPFGDSRSLVFYLGRERKGEETGPPIIRFRGTQLSGGWDGSDPKKTPHVIDRWGHAIRYRNPGVHNPGGVDIWSPGANGTDELDSDAADFDDVTNWTKDF